MKIFSREECSSRLAHLLPINSYESMDGQFWQRDVHGHEHRRPEQEMEIRNILADEVLNTSFLPVLLPFTVFSFIILFIAVVFSRRDISDRRIQPDVEVFHFAAFFLAVRNFKAKIMSVARDAPVF